MFKPYNYEIDYVKLNYMLYSYHATQW